jgi:uncharacterized membrane protein YtjA (UPF0391 family)
MHTEGREFEKCLQLERQQRRGTSIARSLVGRGSGRRVVGSAGTPSKAAEGDIMLHWAITLFIIAIIAAVLGFGGIAGSAAALAKICFFVFLVLAIASFAFGRRAI